ncbi:MAG: hypothetical protein FWC71_00870 [Defluviitaleaceae bacterium]|nr:hypothetical protein [Defluviitaleaceae bacterium]
MKNILVVISGMPATGKTRFSEWLSCEKSIPLLSLDEVWENSGTSDIPFAQYWTLCEDMMNASGALIIEFGFDNKIKPAIKDLIKRHNYKTINVHFDTSFEIAHRRFNDRRLYDMGGSKPQITLEQYMKIAERDKKFRFGECVIWVDTTDFATVSYGDITDQIHQCAMRLESSA